MSLKTFLSGRCSHEVSRLSVILRIQEDCVPEVAASLDILLKEVAKRDLKTNENLRGEETQHTEIETAIIQALAPHQHTLDFGECISKTNDYKQTLAHFAVLFEYTNLLRRLVEWNIDLTVADFNGLTALHYAYNKGDGVCVDLLGEKGASESAPDAPIRTPPHLMPDGFALLNHHNTDMTLGGQPELEQGLNTPSPLGRFPSPHRSHLSYIHLSPTLTGYFLTQGLKDGNFPYRRNVKTPSENPPLPFDVIMGPPLHNELRLVSAAESCGVVPIMQESRRGYAPMVQSHRFITGSGSGRKSQPSLHYRPFSRLVHPVKARSSRGSHTSLIGVNRTCDFTMTLFEGEFECWKGKINFSVAVPLNPHWDRKTLDPADAMSKVVMLGTRCVWSVTQPHQQKEAWILSCHTFIFSPHLLLFTLFILCHVGTLHSHMIKIALALFDKPPLLIAKWAMFVFILEVINGVSAEVFFTQKSSAEKPQYTNKERTCLAQKRACAAKRERQRELERVNNNPTATASTPAPTGRECKTVQEPTMKHPTTPPPPSPPVHPSPTPHPSRPHPHLALSFQQTLDLRLQGLISRISML